MIYKILDKKDYEDFLKKLIENYDFYGPVRKDKAVHDFQKIKDFKKLDTDFKRTTIAPAKKLIYPPVETILSYDISDDIKINSKIQSEEIILFGIDACDVNGLAFLDRFFADEFFDDFYFQKRNKLTVIGLDRMPSETNFSLSLGKEYAREGFDIFMTDLKDRYFLRIGTEKGNNLVNQFASVKDATEKDFADYDKYMDDYRKSFKAKADISNFYDNFEIVYDNDKFWSKTAKDCFSCGSCCLVCPTCFCFNVRDDMEINLKKGNKIREWDSCMIPDYGLVAGGHNFRKDKENRLKQRYRCKLKTFVQKFDTYACVGCGRCIEACMAKINIVDDINSVKKEVSV